MSRWLEPPSDLGLTWSSSRYSGQGGDEVAGPALAAEPLPEDGVHFGVAQFGTLIGDIDAGESRGGGFAGVGAYRGVSTEVGFVLRQLGVEPVGQVGALLQFGALGGGDCGHPADDVVAGVLAAVDADPAAVVPAGGDDGSGAAGEWVKHQIALVAAGQDDALVQGQRLLVRESRCVLGTMALSRCNAGISQTSRIPTIV